MSRTIIIDLTGYELSAEEMDLLRHPKIAGVLLFARNIHDRHQLTQLTQTIHRLRPELVIMTDQEGGNVARIQRMNTRSLMSARCHGDIFDQHPETGLTMAHLAGKTMATDLLALGIDISFAPVLDLHNDNSKIIGQLDRAFHADPSVVTQLAAAFIDGMHEAGMPAVGKHFPGHGSCVGDSHLELPVNLKSEMDLRATDLKPFIDLMQQKRLDAVMSAHVLYPAIDADHAAGYSKQWLQTLLRDELCFQGPVISDCLGMAGADIGSLDTRAAKALDAGCDWLIVANQPRAVLKHLLEHLTSVQNHPSVARIEQFKQGMKRFTEQKANTTTYTGAEFFSSAPLDKKEQAPAFLNANPTTGV
jgi:beta-N-acetylhexosaminidase